MSWSAYYIGTPEKISEALDEQSEQLSGQSKDEFDAAKPHLQALLKENRGNIKTLINLQASGSGYTSNGEEISRSCNVKIESVMGVLL